MTAWQRINKELLRKQKNWQWLANSLGMEIQRVHNWKSRGVPAMHYRSIAGILGVTVDWIEGVDTSSNVAEPLAIYEVNLQNNPDYPAIRRVSFKLSAGVSGYAIDYDAENDAAPIVFSKRWYQSRKFDPSKLFAVRVANGSMEPGLCDGDTVVVNTAQKEPKDGQVFAVNYEGVLVIKRMIRDAGEWWLSSDNPDQRRYPRKLCDETTHMIGEIVHKQSERI